MVLAILLMTLTVFAAIAIVFLSIVIGAFLVVTVASATVLYNAELLVDVHQLELLELESFSVLDRNVLALYDAVEVVDKVH